MRFSLPAFLLASAFAPAAFAQEPAPAPTTDPRYAPVDSGQYISLAGGFVGATDYDYDIGVNVEAELESGFGFAGAWGQRFSDNWRGEIGISYRSQSIESVTIEGGASPFEADDVSVVSLDLNVYYDFPTGEGAFRPYMGAGAGVGTIDMSDGIIDGSGTALTLQAMAGGSFKVSDKTSLFLEGRYQWAGAGLDTDGDEEDSEEDLRFGGFAAYAGVRFGF